MEYISTIIMVCVIIWGVMQKRKIYQLEKELNSIKEQIEYMYQINTRFNFNLN